MSGALRHDLARGVEPEAGPLDLVTNLGLHALLVYRLRKRLSKMGPIGLLGVPFVALLSLWVRKAYGITLDPRAEIGPGMYIGHYGAIHLRGCRVGALCSIAQCVSIGPTRPGEAGPTLGDRVWVGAHARIEGDVTVGDGATISAGAVVTRDVPPGALVAGSPARVINAHYDNAALLMLKPEGTGAPDGRHG